MKTEDRRLDSSTKISENSNSNSIAFKNKLSFDRYVVTICVSSDLQLYLKIVLVLFYKFTELHIRNNILFNINYLLVRSKFDRAY